MAEQKAKPATASKRSAHIVFTDSRFDNITIVWRMGTRTLELCSRGGAGTEPLVLKTTTFKEDTTPENADKAAGEWFESLGGVWQDTEFDPDYDEDPGDIVR